MKSDFDNAPIPKCQSGCCFGWEGEKSQDDFETEYRVGLERIAIFANHLKDKDVKVSINDNTIEITIPGLLSPSIDYNDMLSRQSDVRNKVLAPVFKRLGLIDQLGNGLAFIHDELKACLNVRMTWKEVGLSFQVAFVRKVLSSAYPRTNCPLFLSFHSQQSHFHCSSVLSTNARCGH